MTGCPLFHRRRTDRAGTRGGRPHPESVRERVPDELYARASVHYDDKALWTLTLAIAQICFFIPVALIAKPIPGKEPHYSK
jgi:alkylhydroperoxidase family enzyme